ncbi:hypothetical protein P171DRAFT_486043 [Karstenula rhodostoma CBS 690.94]|uniref:Uncharacterized protein n=1 Tax=Karstenula rhodostoma CBS 690.94 TaxID=1392251 RepID=A0A9P4PFY1_9PLEO|nr:hypothetical protein P171DRAFT_486043 [Karstenula rhodostoma CBS 690.94]
MSSKTNAYVVTFISGKSDAVDRIEANLLRDGGSLSSCDSALMYIEPAMETPRCCNKIGAKVAGLNEQVENEKNGRIQAEILVELRKQDIERNEKIYNADRDEIRAAAKQELDNRDEKIKKLEADLAAVTAERQTARAEARERIITAPAPVLAVLKRKVSAAQDGLAATKNELDATKKEAETQKHTITQLRAASVSELAVVKGQLAATQTELEVSKKDAEDQKQIVTQLTVSASASTNKLAVTMGQLATTQNELEVSKKDAEDQKQIVIQLTASTSASVEKLAVIKGQLAATQDEVDARNKEVQIHKQDIARLTASTDELDIVKGQLATTQNELDASKKESQDLKQTIAQLTAANNELEASQKEALARQITDSASASELAAVKDELTAAKSELDILQTNKKVTGINNFRTVSKKNGELAILKKDIEALYKEAGAHQYTVTKLAAIQADLEASKNEVHELNFTVTQLTADKKDIVQQLTVTSRHLEVCMKEAQDTASELVAVKAELDERKKMTRPQKHLSNQIAAAKKELEAAKQESQMHQQDALDKHMDAVAAKHQLAQYQSAYDESQHTIAHLEAKTNSLNSTQVRISEALRTTQHELISAKTDATVAAQDLAIEKKSNISLAAESTRAQATITDLRSELEIVKIELGAFKAPEETAAAPAPAPAPASPQSAAEKMAAWGNAHALVRADDEATRRANAAKAAAMKDQPAGEWKTTFRATGSALAKQSKVDAARAVLDSIEKELAAKDAVVAGLKETLREERTVGAERKRELAAARLVLESTQGSLREARAALAAADTAAAQKEANGCARCPGLERSVRIARAGADAALAQVDDVHYKCMSTWAVLHDVTWDVETKLSLRSGTPELAAVSTSEESDGSEVEVELEVVGGDGEGLAWDRNTPPHLRRGGFAGRSLARHMPDLVRK